MNKLLKWFLVLIMVVPTWSFAAPKQSQTASMLAYFKEQNIAVILNGQTFSMFIPVDKLFVENSTNLMTSHNMVSKLKSFISQYDPSSVMIVGRYANDVTQKEQDLVREQATLFMRSLDLKAPGRVVSTSSEPIVKNINLEFWQNVETTQLIEVRWESNLQFDFMVPDAG